MLGDLGAKALTMAAFVLLARGMQVGSFGHLAWALSIVSYASLACDWGLAQWGTREVVKSPGTMIWYCNQFSAMRLIFAVLVVSVIASVSYLTIGEWAARQTLVISALWLIPSMCNLEWAVQALNSPATIGAVRLVGALALFGITWWWCLTSGQLFVAAGVRGVAELVPVALNVLVVRHRSRCVPRLDGIGPGESIHRSLPMLASTMCASIYAGNLDTILVGAYRSAVETAHYAAAYRVYGMLLVIPKLLLVVYYPEFARVPRNDAGRLSAKVRELGVRSAVSCMPLIVLTVVFAPEMMALVFGERYATAGMFLPVLAVGAVAVSLSAGLPSMLMATGHANLALVCFGVSMGVNVFGNIATVPKWGAMGAAVATALAELTSLTLSAVLVRRTLHLRMPGPRHIFRALLPASAVGAFAFLTKGIGTALYGPNSLLLLALCGTGSLVLGGAVALWVLGLETPPQTRA